MNTDGLTCLKKIQFFKVISCRLIFQFLLIADKKKCLLFHGDLIQFGEHDNHDATTTDPIDNDDEDNHI